MKKNILFFASLLLGAVLMASCSPDEGTDPGSDGAPVATVFTYSTPGDGYSADNDVRFRVATNNKDSVVTYLAELTSAKDARKMSDDEYAKYVEQNGTKVSVGANNYKDVYVTDLHGEYTITVVANSKIAKQFEFAGLDFKTYGTGTYTSDFFGGSWPVKILHSDIGDRYRIVDAWGYEGYNADFTIEGSTVNLVGAPFETGYVHKKYGMVSASANGNSTYDSAKKTITFNYSFKVSVGSFGDYSDTLVMP